VKFGKVGDIASLTGACPPDLPASGGKEILVVMMIKQYQQVMNRVEVGIMFAE
jgi:hypothetical protein